MRFALGAGRQQVGEVVVEPALDGAAQRAGAELGLMVDAGRQIGRAMLSDGRPREARDGVRAPD